MRYTQAQLAHFIPNLPEAQAQTGSGFGQVIVTRVEGSLDPLAFEICQCLLKVDSPAVLELIANSVVAISLAFVVIGFAVAATFQRIAAWIGMRGVGGDETAGEASEVRR